MEIKSQKISEGRGWSLYTNHNLIPHGVVDKDGNSHTAKIQSGNLYRYLSPWDCEQIAMLDSDIFSIVSQRSQIFSGMQDSITPIKKIEDEIAFRLKRSYRLAMQYDRTSPVGYGSYVKYWHEINSYLKNYNLFPDLSNFDKCMRIYFDDIKFYKEQSSQEVLDWVYQPRAGSQIQDFKKKWVRDNLIHGRNAIQLPTDGFDGFEIVPAGTIYQVPEEFVGQYNLQWYVQLTYGMNGWSSVQRGKIFSSEEMSTAQYIPSTAIVDGLKPMDALMYQIIMTTNLNELLAENSNGSKAPEYLILITENEDDGGYAYPSIDSGEIERQETSVNEKRKDSQVRIHKTSGNSAQLFNLSRENIINVLSPYTEYVRKAKAMVFHATPNEMGDTNTGGMIAKAGAEAQQQLYYSQSINPLAIMWENQFTLEVLPKKFYQVNDNGKKIPIWDLRLRQETTIQEKIELANALKGTQSVTVNELRELMGYDRTGNPIDDEIQPIPQPTSMDIMEQLKSITQR